MSKRDEQIARMKGLMTYGISKTSQKVPVTESIEAPDGKIYAIIREGSKFYIKSTPKGSELVTESFDYIGGFMNKKNNEFTSYNQASKNLELKVRSINEAYGVNKTVELLNPNKKEELIVEMTDSMKQSLSRYRQIMNNACSIMNESAKISMENTGNPEAPKTTNFSPKLGEPFNQTASATLDKDLKDTATDPEKQGEPFGEKEKSEGYKDAQYVPSGSVANQKPSGGKVVRVNENEDFEETIEECDEWGSCGLNNDEGVGEIGDGNPFEEIVNEDTEEFVGFADDENSVDENEENDSDLDDIDLDDIDLDLDSDEMEEPELDDIDSEDENQDSVDVDNENDKQEENNEIDLLRQEIEVLKQKIANLQKSDDDGVYDENDDEEYDIEFDNDNEEDEDDLEFDNDSEEDEDNQLTEAINIGYEDMPFEVKVRYHVLQDTRVSYGLAKALRQAIEKEGVKPTIFQIRCIETIGARVRNILVADDCLTACKKEKYFDVDVWYDKIEEMHNNYKSLKNILYKIKDLLSEESFSHIMRMADSIGETINRQENYFVNYVDPVIEQDDDNDDDFEQQNYQSDNDYNDDDKYHVFDSIKSKKLNENGTKLNVFGKHPGYRKKPMTLPQTTSDNMGDYKDWNDESVYSEEPFGNKIGTSLPYEYVINKTIDTVLESIKKKN